MSKILLIFFPLQLDEDSDKKDNKTIPIKSDPFECS